MSTDFGIARKYFLVYTEVMKRERGRPRKPEGEKFVKKLIRFPPDLWETLQAEVPAGERSAVIQEGLRRELARLKRKQNG
jgi:hypothetical protein